MFIAYVAKHPYFHTTARECRKFIAPSNVIFISVLSAHNYRLFFIIGRDNRRGDNTSRRLFRVQLHAWIGRKVHEGTGSGIS